MHYIGSVNKSKEVISMTNYHEIIRLGIQGSVSVASQLVAFLLKY